MRHDKLSYAKPLFLEEYKILAGLNGIQGLTSMLQGGFLKPDPSSVWPSELAPLSKDAEQKASAVQVSGKLALFSPEETGDLLQEMDERLADDRHPVIVNLASQEYFKVADRKALKARVVECVFEDWKGDAIGNGQYKIISFFAKRARGLMTRYAAEHRLKDVEALKQFDSDDYAFAPEASDDTTWVFRRKLV